MGAAGSVAGGFVTFFISLVFAIYILTGKETLKRQVGRLIRVWLPEKFGSTLLHVSAVCGRTFRLFIAGQAMEAVILGTLCMVGMAILQIPYAPMIGALVGVTALIPVVGAFVGVIVGAIMILTVNPIKAVVFVVFLLVLLAPYRQRRQRCGTQGGNGGRGCCVYRCYRLLQVHRLYCREYKRTYRA